ncbi:fungal-specific transcription factor domain-containing protein [Lipomyces orientalis]|uniref:Fungal-specific transcription factor domain-containing protein n=1 Tax=Lipomyces orientalis TaxID=1233043 RepID=A0ACC3TJF3_9ASCO
MPPLQPNDSGSSNSGGRGRASRRARTVISCNECHRRKQKCDRLQPCNQCIGRRVESLCQYATRSSSPRLAATTQTGTKATEIGSASSSNSSPNTYVHTSSSTNELSPGNYDEVSTAVEVSRKRRTVADNSEGENNSGDMSNSDSLAESDIDSEDDDDDVDGLGYFKSGVANIAQDVAELNLSYKGVSPAGCASSIAAKRSKAASRNRKVVSRVLRAMPPRPYVELLVRIFFTDANFYQSLNEVAFWESLRQWWELPDRASNITTPMLTFRLMSISIQFVPKEHLATVQQIDHSLGALTKDYSQAARELSVLLPDCIDKVTESLLFAAWWKYEARMKESWYSLATAIRMAQEIKLDIEEPDTPPSYEREQRRRLWWTIYHWDRCMGLILGRPTMIKDEAWDVPLPLDLPDKCYYPSITPAAAVTEFTGRVLAFKLAPYISELDTDPHNLYKNLAVYTASLPAYFAIFAPDTSLDEQYPYLIAQRESMATTICMILCALHRRNVPVPDLLSFCLRLLTAADRMLSLSREHQYRQFMHVYQNLEPSVLICREILKTSGRLAESGFVMCRDRFGNPIDVWQCLRAVESALARLKIVRPKNRVAGKAYRIVKELFRRVKVQVEEERVRYDRLHNADNGGSPPDENVVETEIKKVQVGQAKPASVAARTNETSVATATSLTGSFPFAGPRSNGWTNQDRLENADLTDIEDPMVDDPVMKIMQQYNLSNLVRASPDDDTVTPTTPPETLTSVPPDFTFDKRPPSMNPHYPSQLQMQPQPQPPQQQHLAPHQLLLDQDRQIDNGDQMMVSWADEIDIENWDMSAIGEQMDFGML